MAKRMAISVVTCALAAVWVGCGGSDRSHSSASNSSPTAPTASASATAPSMQAAPPALIPQRLSAKLAPSSSGPQDVAFPPRNEPFDFRANALEARYRDGLRRPSISSFVDIEGTIVWTQEYLRYRVNLCGHLDSVAKVFAQIDGLGIQQVCGIAPPGTPAFPPRNEPFDFRNQLEAKYRDGLRRSAVQTFVDVEGDIVWTQEYLRYRVSGCTHQEATSKVLAQIDGAGIPADCTPKPLQAQFTVTGPQGANRCRAPAVGLADCTFNAAASSGPVAITSYAWTYTSALATGTGTGQLFVPTIGCGFAATGTASIPLTVTLTVTDAAGTRASASNASVVALRPPGDCGVTATAALTR